MQLFAFKKQKKEVMPSLISRGRILTEEQRQMLPKNFLERMSGGLFLVYQMIRHQVLMGSIVSSTSTVGR